MEQITVVVVGETENMNVTVEKDIIDHLEAPPGTRSDWAKAIGESLDGKNSGKLLPLERNSQLALLISAYVSVLSNYQIMSALGYKTIVLTFFKTRGIYEARVAGILPYDFLKVTCTLDGNNIPAHHGLLLVALSGCPYYTGPYEKSSIFHKLKEEAAINGPRIEIVETT